MASLSESHLNCDICLEVATEAVESDCCHHLFCSSCVQNLTGCPICRNATVRYTANHILRRIIGDLPVSCDYTGCTASVTRSNADSHRKSCSFGKLKCPMNGCDAKLLPVELIAHLATSHKLTDSRERLNVAQSVTDAAVYHQGVRCDGCNQRPIQNRRYKCMICADYDLCENCEGQRIHEEHPMIRVSDPTDNRWKKGFTAASQQSYQDPRIAEVMATMSSMGFSYTNEGGWLSTLIELKGGDVNAAVNILLNGENSGPRISQLETNRVFRRNDECALCKMRFGSRNALFAHLEESGHAI